MPHLSPASRGLIRNRFLIIELLCLLAICHFGARAATPDRIVGAIDSTSTRPLAVNVHRLAQARYDQGVADPLTPMNYMVMLLQPSAAQQADLKQLLADQQNPASPAYRKWLTSEAFSQRFGMSAGDLAKISAWLKAEGFTVNHQARSGNWIAFSGVAAQTSRTFHTSIHRYSVNGKTHFANATEPRLPPAFTGVVGALLGLNDFEIEPAARLVSPTPQFNSGTQHYLAPADFATIYDLTPLQQAGLDGTGQSIAIVGQSDVLATDLSQFRTRYGLPANTPKLVLYNGIDPGYNSSEAEGVLDLEWAGAIAPKATLYYVYGASAVTAMVVAIEEGFAPIVSVSYGSCEVDYAAAAFEAVAQQANAQGITLVAASGDSGGAGCDGQGFLPMATLGRSVDLPAALPEVTGVGGTQFVEGTGTYWNPTNTPTFASALSYIPEAVWNESSASGGLLASGGGASRFFPKPAWQTGIGVTNDGARDVPDIAFSAALHDAYAIVYGGGNAATGGTSCGTPTMAGIVALLNQYQVKNGKQTAPGLGNINPQLYRLAQSAPSAFHDITSGDNMVTCAQGTSDCATGSFGYTAAPGYNQAAGLGSLDVNVLFSQWNSAAQATTITLASSASKGTINDTVQLTATVASANGAAMPTGGVSFTFLGGNPLGSVPLTLSNGKLTASVTVPLFQLGGPGTYTLMAQYPGDSVFSGAGASVKMQVPSPAAWRPLLPRDQTPFRPPWIWMPRV